jgi:hypothetical protein
MSMKIRSGKVRDVLKKNLRSNSNPTHERLPMLTRKVSRMREELLRKNRLPVRVKGCGQKNFTAGLFKIVLHDLRAFEFRDRKFFEHGAIAGNPSRTTFNSIRGNFQMG